MSKDEHYVFYQECITSLNASWSIVCALQSEQEMPPVLRWAAYRMALVEYCKPYKPSRGINQKEHKLSFPALSSEDQRVHQMIIALRDTRLAHSDLNVQSSSLYRGEVSGQVVPVIAHNTSALYPEPSQIRSLIEHTLDFLYSQQVEWNHYFNPR